MFYLVYIGNQHGGLKTVDHL